MNPGQDDSFATYLEQVRAHRAELKDSVAAVDEALGAQGARADWLTRLHTALVELAHDFADHVDLTERPGGLYDTVLVRDLRLTPAVHRLTDDHEALHAQIAGVIRAVEDGAPERDESGLHDELVALLDHLVRHRHRAGDLVYQAFGVDLGGQG